MTSSLRTAYGEALVALGRENENIVVLEADLGKSTMSCLFEQAFPDRFFEMGIAEANMASTAAGFALAGKVPFISSFAVFASGRAFDQIRQTISLGRLNVNICGSSAGLSDFGDGSTHQSVEDVAILRAIPGMTVLVPADACETAAMVRAAAAHDGPVYLRVCRNDLPVFTAEDAAYEIGALATIRDGCDVCVFANGAMLSRAVAAAEALAARDISVKVVNASCVKPLGAQTVLDAVGGCKAVVTAEEHSVIGGLGSAVAECLKGAKPMAFVGIEDVFGTSAESYDALLEAYGLTADRIAEAAERLLSGGIR